MALLKKINFTDTGENGELCVPENTVFKGNIVTKSNARINGTVEGDVETDSGNILFGVNSSIIGNVSGNDIAVGGNVSGDIMARGQLSIFSGAKIQGNVFAQALVIEKDAVFEGSVKIEAVTKTQKASAEKYIAPKSAAAEEM